MAEVAEEVDSLSTADEDIRADFREITARLGAPEAEPETPEPPETPDAPKAVERPRDEKGKFAKGSEAPGGDKIEGALDATVEAPPTVPAASDSTVQGIDLNRAPSSWKPAAKAAWAALPEPVRAEIYRREGDFHNGNSAIKETADFGQRIRQVLDPYRMLIQAEGGTPEAAIADTMKTAALFRVGTPQQKLSALLQIAGQFNVPLQDYIRGQAGQIGQPAPAGQQPQQFRDPRVDSLLAEQEKQQRDRAAQTERANNDAANRFLAAKDGTGQPLYPFVDNVLDDMSMRVAHLRGQNPAMSHDDALKQAYEQAVWANPETRAVLIQSQQAAATTGEETLRKVQDAKRASAVNVPKRGALPATQPPSPLLAAADDEIRADYRAILGRAG